jgi:hypothetical protein
MRWFVALWLGLSPVWAQQPLLTGESAVKTDILKSLQESQKVNVCQIDPSLPQCLKLGEIKNYTAPGTTLSKEQFKW